MFFKKNNVTINVAGVVTLMISCACLLMPIILSAVLIISGIKAKSIYCVCWGLASGISSILWGVSVKIYDPILFFRKEDLIEENN